MVKRSLFVLLAMAITIPTYCQTKGHKRFVSIDKTYEECKQQNNTSVGICNCAYEAYKKWDAVMNLYLNRLLKIVKTKEEQDAIHASQVAWQSFRDAQFASYNKMFNHDSDFWSVVRAESRINFIKERTKELHAYYDTLKVHSKYIK